jgi:hypothetical protein
VSADTGGRQVVQLWRDYDETAIALGARMSLGSAELTADRPIEAGELYASGVRRVSFGQPVDMLGPDPWQAVSALSLIRDLTAYGMVVDWRLRLPPADADWRELGHLYPPAQVTLDSTDGDACQRDWASGYHLAKCVSRRGPGLLEIRDRRWGGLRRVIISKPGYLEAIATLRDGATVEQVPSAILADLIAVRLAGLVGDVAWWLPYQVQRWPDAPPGI